MTAYVWIMAAYVVANTISVIALQRRVARHHRAIGRLAHEAAERLCEYVRNHPD